MVEQTTYRDKKEIFDKIQKRADEKGNTFSSELRTVIREGLKAIK